MQLAPGSKVRLDGDVHYDTNGKGKLLKEALYGEFKLNCEYEIIGPGYGQSTTYIKRTKPEKGEYKGDIGVYTHWLVPWKALTLKDYLDDEV